MTAEKWWQSRPSEDLFIEITRRPDVGADLNAPIEGRAGIVPGAYALVPLVRAGDVIVHYDSRREFIEGVSVALGSAVPQTVLWGARGMSARRAGVRPSWRPGLAVPLGGHDAVSPPVSFAELQQRKVEILAIQERLKLEVGPRARLHFPWYEYGGIGGPLRTQQAYLVKLPAEVVSLFPALDAAIRRVRSAWSVASLKPMPETEEAQEQVERAAGQSRRSTRRRSLRQGYITDQEAKVAIEARAMNAAIEHYSATWEVEDVHGTEGYDLLCRRDGTQLHVEVKGTTGDGASVLLTRNEVEHARGHVPVGLFVLSGVELVRDGDGRVIDATGGRVLILEPWDIGQGVLRPVGYEYRLPGTSDRGRDS